MSGATLKDLTKYHQRAMQYFKNGLVSEQNRLYAQTEEAGAVSFWPLGGTPLEGKVKFSFKETPPASGEKGPENPSAIAGVSNVSVTRCGKNLAELNRVYALPNRGITATVNTDGLVHIEGTSGASIPLVDIGNHDDSANKQLPYWMEVGKTYTISFNSSNAGGNPRANLYLPNSLTAWGGAVAVPSGESYTFTVDNNRKRSLVRIVFDKNSTINCDCYIQIEEGSSATSFDGTIPDAYNLPLGSTYYGGEIDLATGLMTVTHFGTVLTGMVAADAYNGSGLLFLRSWPNGYDTDHISEHGILRPKKSSGIFCDRFPTSGSVTDDRFVIGNYNAGNQTEYLALYLNKETVGITETSLTGTEVRSRVNAYLANHPLTFVYELYTPFTVQLTPLQLTALTQKDKYTPRMNTVYTDADSIQISYRKSLIHDEDEKVQAIVALGGNV